MTALTITPIHTKTEYKAALRHAETLMTASPGSPEADALEVLAIVIEDYEKRHHPLPRASDVEVLQYLMEANAVTQSGLPEIGTQSLVSLILAGKRQLTVRQIKALAERFQVNPGVFMHTSVVA